MQTHNKCKLPSSAYDVGYPRKKPWKNAHQTITEYTLNDTIFIANDAL